MAVLLSSGLTEHVVSVLGPSVENPLGFHRLIGGSIEMGERAEVALHREIGDELNTRLHDVRRIGVLESIFHFEGAHHECARVTAGSAALSGLDSTVMPFIARKCAQESPEETEAT